MVTARLSPPPALVVTSGIPVVSKGIVGVEFSGTTEGGHVDDIGALTVKVRSSDVKLEA